VNTNALVFGPGLPAVGTRGTVAIPSVDLEVAAGGHSKRVPVSELSLREIGFSGFGLELAWKDGGASWAVHVLDGHDARALLASPALASTSQALALRKRQRRTAAGRSLGWTFLVSVALVPLLLLLFVTLNATRIADWVAERVPIEQEIDWGRQLFQGMRGTLGVQAGGAALEAVQSIGSRLTSGSRYRYEFHVGDDSTLNAFAIPGGVIVVHSGLIAATTRPEELAGVLAHEIQHVESRHSLRGVVKDLGFRGLWTLATGDLGATVIGQAALEITSLKFSRDDETEADMKGLDLLIKASIDPSGMPAFFKTMGEKAAGMPVAFLSTHPSSSEREHMLEERIANVTQAFPPLDLGPWPPK
jgi:beta-barrel assembly-enhancing protease